MKVLALTNSYDDLHIEAVKRHIVQMDHELIRVDIDRIVRGEHQILWDYQHNQTVLVTEKGSLNLKDVDSFWWRKPFGFGSAHGFVESINDPVQRSVVDKEVHDLVNGLSATLEDKFWLNRPMALNRARLKPYQLHVARSVGLLTPDTIITNDPVIGRQFCLNGRTVFKPMAEPYLDYDDASYVVETTLVTEAHLKHLNLIKSQPAMFQRYIEKCYELRVTCVGKCLFVAKQVLLGEQPLDAVVDWRTFQGTGKSVYVPGSLPANTIAGIHSLLQRLDLGFAAIDFAVDYDGNCFFLEVNPNGQWLGYSDEIGLPAAAKIATCLVEQARQSKERR